MGNGNYLVIPDLQLPFENEKALSFCAYLKRHYQIDDDHVLNVGDECDQLHGGMYPKDPDGHYTPNSEIKAAREKITEWANIFPVMKVATSNHGMRWAKKASAAEIPSQMLRAYQQVLGIPETWRYQDAWTFKEKHSFMMNHGMDLGGKTPYRVAAEISGISRVFGHLHSSAGICHVKTLDKNVWGFNVGCLIDPEAYAFKYGKDSKFKPNLGAGMIFNEGSTPVWIPLG